MANPIFNNSPVFQDPVQRKGQRTPTSTVSYGTAGAQVADAAPLGAVDALDFCRRLPSRAGVVGVPVSVFHDDPEAARTLVRFAFCKRDVVLAEAVSRLASASLGAAG